MILGRFGFLLPSFLAFVASLAAFEKLAGRRNNFVVDWTQAVDLFLSQVLCLKLS